MATETLTPSGVASSSNLTNPTNVLVDDTSWATAADNNTNSVILVDFPTPTGNPTAGAGLQGCTVKYRVTANASSVSFSAYICEGGVRLNGGSPVDTWASSSTAEATRQVTWDASLLGTADGSAMQLEVVGAASGGKPSARTTGEFQYLDWDVEYSVADNLLADDVQSLSELTSPALAQSVFALNATDVESLSELTSPALAQSVFALTATSVQSLTELTAPVLTNVAGADNLLAEDVESLSELTSPTLVQSVFALNATDVESLTEVSAPVLAHIYNLTANDVDSLSEVGSPTVGQDHGLLSSSVESLSELSAPSVSILVNLLATSVETTSELTLPALAETAPQIPLLANDVESLTETSAPTIGQGHGLLGTGVSTTSEVSGPSVGQEHTLLSISVESTASVSTATLKQIYAFSGDPVESLTGLTVPSVGVIVHMSPTAPQSLTEVSSPSTSPIYNLLAQPQVSFSEVSSPFFSQTNVLSSASIESTSSVSVPELVALVAIGSTDVETTTEVTSPTVSQVHVLNAISVESKQTLIKSASNPKVGQVHILSVGYNFEYTSEVTTPRITNQINYAAIAAKNSTKEGSMGSMFQGVSTGALVCADEEATQSTFNIVHLLNASNMGAVFIQPTEPDTLLERYLWIQTGLGPTGQDYQFIFRCAEGSYSTVDQQLIEALTTEGAGAVFIQPDQPDTTLETYLWIQTGLGPDGEDHEFIFVSN